jgi:hypothetical protein
MKSSFTDLKSNPNIIWPLYIILGLVIFWPSLNGLPVFDDNSFIFQSSKLFDAPSPWAFWDPSSGFTRSWPLSFSILWGLYQIFGQAFWCFKLVNILLHSINAVLVYNITKKRNPLLAIGASLLFLCHPMQVETVSWMFQFKTILSVFFYLLAHIQFEKFVAANVQNGSGKYTTYILAIILFYFSLVSKITAILGGILFIGEVFRLKPKKKIKHLLLTIPFLLLSLYQGLETFHGIRVDSNEVQIEKEFEENASMEQVDAPVVEIVSEPEVIAQNEENASMEQVDVPVVEIVSEPEVIAQNEEVPYDMHLINPMRFTSVDQAYSPSKFLLMVSNASFYIWKFFVPYGNSLVYEKTNFRGLSNHLLIGFVIALLTFIFLRERLSNILGESNWYTLSFYFFTIFPVLGFYYVPYMKFSLVADHWAYFALFPLSLLFCQFITLLLPSKYFHKALAFFVILCCIQTVRYLHLFNDDVAVIEHAIETNPTEYSIRRVLNDKFFLSQNIEKLNEMYELKNSESTWDYHSDFYYQEFRYLQLKKDFRAASGIQINLLRSHFYHGEWDRFESIKEKFLSRPVPLRIEFATYYQALRAFQEQDQEKARTSLASLLK